MFSKVFETDFAAIKVPEGDGCKRLDPPPDPDSEALRKAAHRHRSTPPSDDAHRFALMQKFFDRLTALKLYADLVSIDFTLVRSASVWFNT